MRRRGAHARFCRGPVEEPAAQARVRPRAAPLRAGFVLRGGPAAVRPGFDRAGPGPGAGALVLRPPRGLERPPARAAAVARHGHQRGPVLLPRRPDSPDRRADLQLDPADQGPTLQGRVLLDLHAPLVPPQRPVLSGPVHLPALRDPDPVRDLVPEGDGDEDRPPRLRQHGVHLRPAAHHPGRRRGARGQRAHLRPLRGWRELRHRPRSHRASRHHRPRSHDHGRRGGGRRRDGAAPLGAAARLPGESGRDLGRGARPADRAGGDGPPQGRHHGMRTVELP